MNKITKTLLIVTAVIALIGSILVLAALFMGADIRDAQIGITRVIKPGNSQTAEVQLSVDEVRGLDLEIGDAEVAVEAWDENYLKVSHNGGFRRYEAHLENGIYEVEAGSGRNIVGIQGNLEKKLTIFVPKDMLMDELEVSLGAGSVEIQGITVERLDAEVGAGAFAFKGKLSGNANLECGAGEMTLQLEGEPEDYNYNLECGIGEILVNGTKYSGIGGEHRIQNNADKTIRLECGVGKMEVTTED